MLANSTFQTFGEWLLERAKDVPNLPLEEQLDKLLGLEMGAGITPIDSVQRTSPENPQTPGAKRGVDRDSSGTHSSKEFLQSAGEEPLLGLRTANKLSDEDDHASRLNDFNASSNTSIYSETKYTAGDGSDRDRKSVV